MDYQEANEIIKSIFENGCKDDSFHELRDDFIKSAAIYAHLRCLWYLADENERIEMDQERSSSHDAFIDSCNILSRYMTKAGLDNSWREKLGSDRKRIGDLACWIQAYIGLLAR